MAHAVYSWLRMKRKLELVLSRPKCVSSQGKAIMEEYNPDYEFNMIAWVADGAVHAVSIADREKSSEVSWEVPHVSRIVYPSRLQDSVREEALAIVQRVSAYVGLRNGPICMQFFWSAKRGLQVCEIAGRVFGYEHELLFYSSGLRVEDLLLDTVYDKKSLRRRLEDHDIDSFSRCCCGLYFHGREAVIGSMDGAVAAIGNAGILSAKVLCTIVKASASGMDLEKSPTSPGYTYAQRIMIHWIIRHLIYTGRLMCAMRTEKV